MYLSAKIIPHARLQPFAPNQIQLTNGFWKQWQRVNHASAIPHGYRMLEKSGTLNNMRMAAEPNAAMNHTPEEFKGYVFQDSDIYKWLEAASISLGEQPNPELASNLQSLISNLQSAQFPDGYLDSYFTFVKPNRQWTDLEWAHEMYCAGHLIEAGIAQKRATGRTELFDIGKRFADHIDATFGEGKRAGLCGHPEIELSLVELYRETNDARYLKLAQYLLDRRGHQTFAGLRHIGPLYMQDHVPVREAKTVEGHAVRQLYLCAGVTDVYLETGERALLDALERQWDDMTLGKMYLTGGVGARGYGEMFGKAYELPTKEAYCETCAAIAAMMWNWRMLLATNDVRYADALERVLYNGFLSGIALDGTRFLYENPLRSDGGAKREEWFGCACCPPNVMRALAWIQQYAATTTDAGVQLHQYMNGRVSREAWSSKEHSAWSVESDYPWDGKIRITSESAGESELTLRVPGWCKGAQLRVNEDRGLAVNKGYVTVQRIWEQGDIVELNLPMPPCLTQSHPYVDATRGCVAIERGPLVYCIESQDQRADVNDLQVDATQPPRAEWDAGLLGGMVKIHAQGVVIHPQTWSEQVYREVGVTDAKGTPTKITAIPYYAWGNRDVGKMRVWIPTI